MATRTRLRRSRYRFRPRWMTTPRIVVAAGLAVLLVVGVFGYRTLDGLAHLFHTSVPSVIGSLIKGKSGSTIEKNQVASDQRINIALYGYGGPGHDGPYLSDSIMVVSIQPHQGGAAQVAEISIPRDWYVPIYDAAGKKVDEGRVNQAYSDGMIQGGGSPGSPDGGALADAALSRLLGIPIDYYIGLDFTAFKQAVDAVGGIDIDVPTGFTDPQYPSCDADTCPYTTVSFHAGEQHMDGATALEYARSRHGDNGQGTDFARSQRQQQILVALKQKVLSVGGIGDLPDLLNALGDNVDTNMSIDDAEAVYDLVKGVSPGAIVHASLDDTNFLYECGYPAHCGAAYLFAHDSSYAAIDNFIKNVLVSPAALAETAAVGIEDGSGIGDGASARWSAIFAQLGWTAPDLGRVPTEAGTEVIDQSGGREAAAAQWFAAYFGVPVTRAAEPSPGASGSHDGVLVILGADEERAFGHDPGYGS
ncbi:MAG TPA: LCP family protein [Candidatus Binatia bacterium]|nr:LCP family protein [Candidatus Binatia bacterium]